MFERYMLQQLLSDCNYGGSDPDQTFNAPSDLDVYPLQMLVSGTLAF